MIVAKLETGNVEFRDNDGNGFKLLPPEAVLIRNDKLQRIDIVYSQNNIHSIALSDVDFTQIDPNAAIAFTGTLQDLYDALSTTFFFDVTLDNFVYPAGSEQRFAGDQWANGGSTVTLAADDFLAIPIVIETAVNIDLVRIRAGATTSAGSSVLGIYEWGNGISGGNKLFQTSDTVPFNNLVNSQSDSVNWVLPKGQYFCCFSTSSAYSLQAVVNALSVLGTTGDVLTTIKYLKGTVAYNNVMPTTMPGGLSPQIGAHCPIFAFRIV